MKRISIVLMMLLVAGIALSYVFEPVGQQKPLVSVNSKVIVTASRENGHQKATQRPVSSDAVASLEGGGNKSYQQKLRFVVEYCGPLLRKAAALKSNEPAESKLGWWCRGLEGKVAPGQVPGILAGGSNEVSPVQVAVTALYSKRSKGGLDARGLAEIASTPQDYAAIAQALDKFNSKEFWGELDRTAVRNPEVIARFAGMSAGCSVRYCGPGDPATLDLCTWPGMECSASNDFETALLNNFSGNDIARLHFLAKRLIALRTRASSVTI